MTDGAAATPGHAPEPRPPDPAAGAERGGHRPGWHPVHLEPMPPPTYWPAVMAVGIMATLWGFATTWVVAIVGLGLFATSVVGWIGDLGEPPDDGGGQRP